MLYLPKQRVMLMPLRIRNGEDQPLTVWIEPWADRYELQTDQALDIVLAGPERGLPEIISGAHRVTIYGWEGSEAFAFHDGRPAGAQPSLSDVVQQEFEIAGTKIESARTDLPIQEIAMAQRAMDSAARPEPDSLHDTIWLVGMLIHELAEALKPSAEAAAVLWQIASRVLESRGVTLAIAEPKWCRGLGKWRRTLEECAINLLPESTERSGMQVVRPLRADHQPSEGRS